MRVIVTGATGRVGGRAVRRLLDEGHRVTAVVRRPDAALPAGTDVVVADLTAPGGLKALPEADGVFLVFPSLQADRWAGEIIAALAARSPQIVYLSAAGVESASPDGVGIMSSHAKLEQLITRSAMKHTFLRASGFAANTLGWAPQIVADGSVRWPYGDAVRTLIGEDDLAAVGVRALLERHRGTAVEDAAHHLTGPQQLSQREYATIIGEVTGRPVRYVELSEDEALAELFGDLPEEFGRSILTGQQVLVQHPEPVTATVADLLGRPAQTFADWVADHRNAFLPR